MVKSKIPEKKDIVIMIPVEPGAAIPTNLEYRAYMINIIENIKEKRIIKNIFFIFISIKVLGSN